MTREQLEAETSLIGSLVHGLVVPRPDLGVALVVIDMDEGRVGVTNVTGSDRVRVGRALLAAASLLLNTKAREA